VRAVVDVVLVLHAHHRRDRERLVDVLLGDVGKAQVPDQPRELQAAAEAAPKGQ
jgi:hypothetical protein